MDKNNSIENIGKAKAISVILDKIKEKQKEGMNINKILLLDILQEVNDSDITKIYV